MCLTCFFFHQMTRPGRYTMAAKTPGCHHDPPRTSPRAGHRSAVCGNLGAAGTDGNHGNHMLPYGNPRIIMYLWLAVSCYGKSYLMLLHVISCYFMLFHVISIVISWYLLAFHVLSCYFHGHCSEKMLPFHPVMRRESSRLSLRVAGVHVCVKASVPANCWGAVLMVSQGNYPLVNVYSLLLKMAI